MRIRVRCIRPRVHPRHARLAYFVLVASCTGRIGEGGSPTGGAGLGTPMPPAPGCHDPSAGCVPSPASGCDAMLRLMQARMLSATQYDRTASDLLGIPIQVAKLFGENPGPGLSLARLDELGVERRATAARQIAEQAVANLAVTFPCDAAAVGVTPCVEQWLQNLARRAYRRQPEVAEVAELRALFEAGAVEGGASIGVEWLLTGLLQTPDFLYRMARNRADLAGQVIPLSGYELASRLSYFLWDTMPDEQLFSAAETGHLGTSAGLKAEAERMLYEPKFEAALTSFYWDWLGLGVYQDVARDDPNFTQHVIDSLQASVKAGIHHLYAQPHPNFAQLLTDTTYYFDNTLAGFYGAHTAAPGFAPVDLAAEGRRGIVTHPALMAALARPNQTFPIARGLFVLDRLLCQHLSPPAGIIIPPLDPVPPGGTERDQLQLHSSSPVCQGCHRMIDPLGFAFQNFDELGRLRTTTRQGGILDTTGTVVDAGDMDGPFANSAQLLERAATSHVVRRCYVESFFQFGVSRGVDDKCGAGWTNLRWRGAEARAVGSSNPDPSRFRQAAVHSQAGGARRTSKDRRCGEGQPNG